MNSSSILLCFVFAAIGYVIQPILLPALVESKFVAESTLSESYKEEQKKKNGIISPQTDTTKKPDVAEENVIPEPVKPDVVEIPEVPAPAPEPEITPEPEPEPEIVVMPEPEKPEVKPVVRLSEQELIDALKASVKAGDVNEFSFEQVIAWKRGSEELVGSDSFEVGMVTYKADTIFDVQELDAKALIKDGKVVKWLWPTTNTEMR
jgi:hypothetical protein